MIQSHHLIRSELVSNWTNSCLLNLAARRFMLAFQLAVDELLRTDAVMRFMQPAMRTLYGIDIGPSKAPLGLARVKLSDADIERILAQVEEVSIPAAELASHGV